jgi:hypothetical protein
MMKPAWPVTHMDVLHICLNTKEHMSTASNKSQPLDGLRCDAMKARRESIDTHIQ